MIKRGSRRDLARICSKRVIVGSDVFTVWSAQLGHPDVTGHGGQIRKPWQVSSSNSRERARLPTINLQPPPISKPLQVTRECVRLCVNLHVCVCYTKQNSKGYRNPTSERHGYYTPEHLGMGPLVFMEKHG